MRSDQVISLNMTQTPSYRPMKLSCFAQHVPHYNSMGHEAG